MLLVIHLNVSRSQDQMMGKVHKAYLSGTASVKGLVIAQREVPFCHYQ